MAHPFMNPGSGVGNHRYENLWSLYERFLLKDDNLRKYVLDKDGKSKVKENLVKELQQIDRLTIKLRLDRAVSLINELVKALKLVGSRTVVVDAALLYRGLFGSSQCLGAGILEVGLTWDPVLDLPIIPGSSIKGAVRSFCVEYLTKSRGLNPRASEEVCAALFGSVGDGGHASLVSFFDAIPIEAGRGGGVLSPDVINPHYNALSNASLRMEMDVVPVPVLHLSVSEGTVFRFVIHVPARVKALLSPKIIGAVNELADYVGIASKSDISLTALLTAVFLVGGALRSGIGARTLKGYGMFEVREVRIDA